MDAPEDEAERLARMIREGWVVPVDAMEHARAGMRPVDADSSEPPDPARALGLARAYALHRPKGIEFRQAGGESFWVEYLDRHLMRLSADQTKLVIFCYSLYIILTGRNLRPLATAIDDEACAWTQECNSDRWDKPQATDAPVIERIELYMPIQFEPGAVEQTARRPN